MKDKSIQIFEFKDVKRKELHAVIYTDKKDELFEVQLHDVLKKKKDLENEYKTEKTVFMRFFISDSSNQISILHDCLKDEVSAVSIVEQPPLDGTKVVLWIWMQENVSVAKLDDNMSVVDGGELPQYFTGSQKDVFGVTTSKAQTNHIFGDYTKSLNKYDMTLKDNCIRTWFFVQNIDVNYSGIVSARNEFFARQGLTKDTHFIASTGIQGRCEKYRNLVEMDAYAVKGIRQEQIQYLYAKDYLNPTYEYGVSFERGVCVHLSDRRYVFISGTASIDNKGNVMHVGDIDRQLERACENVEALLAEAECGSEDIAQMIVYLRDIADYALVLRRYEEKYPNVPKAIVYAPVCRPSWLIEMECIAVRKV